MLWGCGDIFFLDSLAHNKNRQLSPSHCHVKRYGVGVFLGSGSRGMGGFCLPCGFHGPALKIDHRNPLQAEKASSVTHVISLDTSSQCAGKLEVSQRLRKLNLQSSANLSGVEFWVLFPRGNPSVKWLYMFCNKINCPKYGEEWHVCSLVELTNPSSVSPDWKASYKMLNSAHFWAYAVLWCIFCLHCCVLLWVHIVCSRDGRYWHKNVSQYFLVFIEITISVTI